MSVNTKNWQELKKPNSLDVKSAGDKQRKATFVAEPLERGFGLTLGNALRRVLLSSLQGAAITSIRIENVLHEFSSLAGVREDVLRRAPGGDAVLLGLALRPVEQQVADDEDLDVREGRQVLEVGVADDADADDADPDGPAHAAYPPFTRKS